VNYHHAFVRVQNGASSWAVLAPWLRVISDDLFNDAMFGAVRTTIVDTICKNFHRQRMDNTVEVLVPQHEYEDTSLTGMLYHLRAIERRVEGNDYLAPTDENRVKVVEEFERTSWPKDKPPTTMNWSVVSWRACMLCVALYMRNICSQHTSLP
jgi:hypothetical protein